MNETPGRRALQILWVLSLIFAYFAVNMLLVVWIMPDTALVSYWEKEVMKTAINWQGAISAFLFFTFLGTPIAAMILGFSAYGAIRYISGGTQITEAIGSGIEKFFTVPLWVNIKLFPKKKRL